MIRARMMLRIGLFALTGLLGACMRWQELAPQSTTSFALDSNQTYRLRLASGETKVISHPRVEGDSVVWAEQVSAGTYWRQERRTMPLSDVRSAAVQRADVGGSLTGLGIGILALAILIGVAGAQSLQGLHF